MAIERRTSKDGKTTTYRARLRLSGRREISSTHARLTDARQWEAAARVALREGRLLQSDGEQHTLAEVVDRYLQLLPTLHLADDRNRRRHALWWRGHLGHLKLHELTPARIALARDELLTTPMRARGAPERGQRAAATVTRYLAALSHMLSLAVEDWGWLTDNPVRRVRKPKQASGRVRYLSPDERARLLDACQQSKSQLLYPIVMLALATGMRRGEILSLRWWQIDFQRATITLEHTKNGERRQIPLVGSACDAIRGLRPADVDVAAPVFPGMVNGQPVDITKAWTTAVRRAKLADFRFHDLRHTTASYLAMRGATLLEIAEILGHRSMQMTRRYAHLSISHTRTVLSAMVQDILPGVDGGRTAQPRLMSP